MMVTVEIVATFAYKVTEHETFIGKSLKESDLYRTYRRKQRNFTYKSEIYYEFIGSGYLAHEISRTGGSWNTMAICHNPEESHKKPE